MDPSVAPALLAGVFLIGTLIGSAGVGGVLLVPLLVLFGGWRPDAAVATCMFSYIFTGIAGTFVYSRSGSISLGKLWPIVAAAGLGAAFASMYLTRLPESALLLAVAAMNLFAGFAMYRTQADPGWKPRSALADGLIGAVTGTVSAISGTGGPVVLIPILLLFSTPVLVAVGAGQVVQLPIGMLSTLVNAQNGALVWQCAIPIAVALTLGSLLGGYMVHRLPIAVLSRGAALAYLAAGGLLLMKTLSGIT